MTVVSTHVKESAVIPFPVETVWAKIKANDFSWWNLVSSATLADGVCPIAIGSTLAVNFKDGSNWTIAVTEASDAHRFLSFDVVACEPPAGASSQSHTIRLYRITATNEALISWVTDFSNDASAEIILDSKYKKLEAFNNLAAALKSA